MLREKNRLHCYNHLLFILAINLKQKGSDIMKKFNYVCFFLVLLTISVFSQTINKSITLYPSSTVIAQKNGTIYEYGI